MGDIFTAIAQYGIVPVIVGALVYILVISYYKKAERKSKEQENEQKRKMAEIEKEEEIEKQKIEASKQTALIETIRNIVTQVVNPEHTPEEQAASKKSNQFVMNQLDCLVREGVDRAYLFSFHNGGKDLLGHGYLRMSITQESIEDDIEPIVANYQGMPRMILPKLYEELDEKDYYNIANVSELKKTDPFTYQFLTKHGVKAAMFRAIKNDKGLMLGFIGVEYINKPVGDHAEAVKMLDKKANRIIGALLGQQK